MKKSLYITLALLATMLLGVSCSEGEGKLKLKSPNKKISAIIEIDTCGNPSYSVLYKRDTIISSSKLGLILSDATLHTNLEVTNIENHWADSTFEMNWWKDKVIDDNHTGVVVTLRNRASHKEIGIEFRVFDDAVAFRYHLPEGEKQIIMDELSEFNILGDATAWWSYADFNTYEKEYFETPIDSAKWVATPFLLRRNSDDIHIAINEAVIVDHPDMTIKASQPGRYKVELTPWKNSELAVMESSFTTPWRMVTISRDAAGIINSNTMVTLAPSAKIVGGTYKPMTYIGIWWSFHLGTKSWSEGERQGATTAEAMRYIDFAADNNIGGVVVEGWNKGWDKWGEEDAFDYVTPADNYDLRKVAAYAQSRGVELIMHHETGADIEGYESLMDSAFKLCQELGIKYVKTGHAGGVSTGEYHHSQSMVEHFARIVATAAKYGIALDMHESIKGSGLERTWPNIMTREAVRGMEWEAWSKGNSPSHTTTLPFTRGLAGPIDYTPGIFDILLKNSTGRVAWNTTAKMIDSTRVHSTLAHQLALMVTIYSPMVMACDLIENYDGHPMFRFVSRFNPDFDESQVIDAQVGDYIAVARRSGDVWYIGATTNEEARELTLPLDFLDRGEWEATIYGDAAHNNYETDPTAYHIETIEVTNKTDLKLLLARGGGAAVVIEKK